MFIFSAPSGVLHCITTRAVNEGGRKKKKADVSFSQLIKLHNRALASAGKLRTSYSMRSEDIGGGLRAPGGDEEAILGAGGERARAAAAAEARL